MGFLYKMKLGVVVLVSGLIMSGCYSYMTPQLGSVAQEDSILMLDTMETEKQNWKTDIIGLNFSTVITGDEIELTGDLIFYYRLTNTYNKVQRFNVIMSFLDNQRQVLSTVDITPMLSVFEIVPEKVKFQVRTEVPQESEAIAFNYYGVFLGSEGTGGSADVYFSPFN